MLQSEKTTNMVSHSPDHRHERNIASRRNVFSLKIISANPPDFFFWGGEYF